MLPRTPLGLVLVAACLPANPAPTDSSSSGPGSSSSEPTTAGASVGLFACDAPPCTLVIVSQTLDDRIDVHEVSGDSSQLRGRIGLDLKPDPSSQQIAGNLLVEPYGLMLTPTDPALGTASFGAPGCASDDVAGPVPTLATDGEPTGEESDLKATKPLTAKSFAKPLSKAGLRASNDNLADALFETKWSATLTGSAVMFALAYPGAFHADLAQVDRASLPGKETLCYGDAHPDNFGFLRLGEDTRYLYNDLDDAGFCTASVDALRYFAILRLYFGDDALTEETKK